MSIPTEPQTRATVTIFPPQRVPSQPNANPPHMHAHPKMAQHNWKLGLKKTREQSENSKTGSNRMTGAKGRSKTPAPSLTSRLSVKNTNPRSVIMPSLFQTTKNCEFYYSFHIVREFRFSWAILFYLGHKFIKRKKKRKKKSMRLQFASDHGGASSIFFSQRFRGPHTSQYVYIEARWECKSFFFGVR